MPIALFASVLLLVLMTGGHTHTTTVWRRWIFSSAKLERPATGFCRPITPTAARALRVAAAWISIPLAEGGGEFAAVPEFTDEVTFKYYILIAGKLLLTGGGEGLDVGIANWTVLAGRELFSSCMCRPTS